MKATRPENYSRWTKAELIAHIAKLSNRARPPSNSTASLELRERELRFRSVFETAVEAIITMGEDRLIESINPAAEKMFGYKADEVIGQNVHILMPQPHRDKHDSYIANYVKTGHAKIIGIGREISGRKKDGTVFPMALSVSEARLPSKRLFTGVIRDLTERKQLEQRILSAADEERRRIASDLHDGVGSHLSGVAFLCDALSKELEAQSRSEAREAKEILKLINVAIGQLRGVAHGLHPVEDSRDGLMQSLSTLAEQNRKAWKVDCELECPDAVLIADPSIANHLYRIAQEAVSNAVKHGKSKKISINLSQQGDQLLLAIIDNGTGMATLGSPETHGLGLRTMAYRAGLFGGTLAVQNNKRKGTTVSCTIHLPSASK